MTAKTLRISPDLTLPTTTVTSTLVVYGGKGMGKTNLGAVVVEELDRCNLRWAWLDPLGVSYGLRHSADGAGPGIECLFLGGPRGDVPIEPAGGAAVADIVVEESVNVLIDFSRKPSGEMWSIGEKVRFVTEYARRLFQRQGELLAGGRRREPLFQVLDEAARYIPQVIPSGAEDIAHCVGAWEQLVEEGRNIGLGVGLLTQRSARMNKSVSELADAMFAFRTVGPNSLGAVLDWLGEHVEKARIKDLAERVRSLERGHALVVSPGWLKFEGVVRIRPRETFDSSATPKPGERARTARGEGARPDLQRIRERMAAVIERAKAEDPRELKKQLAEARAQLKKVPAAAPAASVKAPRVVERKVLKDAQVKRLEVAIARLGESRVKFLEAQHTVAESLHTQEERVAVEMRAVLAAMAAASETNASSREARAGGVPEGRIANVVGVGRPAMSSRPAPVVPRRVEPRAGPGGAGVGTGGLRRILVALAQRPQGLSARQIGVRASLSPKSGTFDTYLSRARKAGWITGERDFLCLSQEGLDALGAYEPLPSGRALLEHWLRELGTGGATRILRALADVYPGELTRQEVAEAANLAGNSGTFDTYVSRLRSLELITGRSALKASDELFD